MGLKSSNERYGAVAVSMHWLSALLIVILIVSGFRAANSVDPASKAAILRLHVPIAVAILALTVLRIVWWWRFDRKPKPVAGSARWQERVARAVHVAFYIVILAMAASGIGIMALSGAAPIIFGGGDVLPNFHDYPPRWAHGAGARIFLALIVLHVGAALYHHFVRRDGLLRRMWFNGRPRPIPRQSARL